MPRASWRGEELFLDHWVFGGGYCLIYLQVPVINHFEFYEFSCCSRSHLTLVVTDFERCALSFPFCFSLLMVSVSSHFLPGHMVDFCAAVALAAPDMPMYFYHIPSVTKTTCESVPKFYGRGLLVSERDCDKIASCWSFVHVFILAHSSHLVG